MISSPPPRPESGFTETGSLPLPTTAPSVAPISTTSPLLQHSGTPRIIQPLRSPPRATSPKFPGTTPVQVRFSAYSASLAPPSLIATIPNCSPSLLTPWVEAGGRVPAPLATARTSPVARAVPQNLHGRRDLEFPPMENGTFPTSLCSLALVFIATLFTSFARPT